MMMHTDFKPIRLEDRLLISSYTLGGSSQICDLSFCNLYGWQNKYDTQWAIIEGTLVIRFFSTAFGHYSYLMPIARDGCNYPKCFQELRDQCLQAGHKLVLMGIGETCRKCLEAVCPGVFDFIDEPASWDYIYLRERLSSLAGKALQSKRNHINKFEKLYPNYVFEALTLSNVQECLSLAHLWLQSHGEDDGRRDELCMIERVLPQFEELGASGGVLRVDGKVVAFTLGAPINTTTFGIHIEKADTSYEGAFAMINKCFVSTLPVSYIYINREEDLGLEGLRKAKLSYKPEYLLHKGIAVLR